MYEIHFVSRLSKLKQKTWYHIIEFRCLFKIFDLLRLYNYDE